MSLCSGQEFDSRYLIRKTLGTGGMGQVYLVEDKQNNNELLAIKLLKKELCSDEKMRRRFVKESKIFAYLKHPNIVKVLAFDACQSQLYMVMEYLQSVSLHEIMDLRMPFSFVLDVTTQLLAALTHAHFRGIIHRDIKPSNILLSLSEDGNIVVKLVDFGIASLPSFAHQNQEFTQTVLGSPYYMAPEQSRGVNSQVGPGTDIYSVGIVLYEILCGEVPFKGESDIETILMHIEDDFPALNTREGQTIPPGIEEVIQKACAKKTWDRYVGAQALSRALQALNYVENEDLQLFYEGLRERIRAKTLQEDFTVFDPPSHDTTRTNGQIEAQNKPSSKDLQSISNMLDASGISDEWLNTQLSAAHSDSNSYHPFMVSHGDSSQLSLQESGFAQNIPSIFNADMLLEHGAMEQQRTERSLELIGREQELAIVRETADLALQGRGKLLIIEGDWGIGKSKIAVSALKPLIEGKILRFGAAFFGHNMQYTGMRNLFEGLLQCRDVKTELLCEFLSFHYRKLKLNTERDTAEILAFLRPESTQASTMPDPFLLVDIIMAICELSPVAILLEDMHNASWAELDFLECFAMQAALQRMQCMIIANVSTRELLPETKVEASFRKLARHEGGSVKTLRVSPLSNENMEQFFKNAFHFDSVLSSCLTRNSYGNPMLGRELAKIQKDERLIERRDDGMYTLKDGAICKIYIPPFFKEVYTAYIERLKKELSRSIPLPILNDILLRLAILGEEFEDELMELFFELEGDIELNKHLDSCIELLIKARMLHETTSAKSQTALRFDSQIPVMTILSNYSMRKLRALHRLAIQVKTSYHRNMDLKLYNELAQHYEAIGETENARVMLFNAFKKAVQTLDQGRIYDLGTQLYSVFNEMFMQIRDQNSSGKLTALTQPIDWPFVLMQLGKLWVEAGKSHEAERFVDALSYCAQRYQQPILLAKAQSLNAMFLLLKEDHNAALQRLDASDAILDELAASSEDYAVNLHTRLQIYVHHGQLKNLWEMLQSLEHDMMDEKFKAMLGFFKAVYHVKTLSFKNAALCIQGQIQVFLVHKMSFFSRISEKIIETTQLWNHQVSKSTDSHLGSKFQADFTDHSELVLDCYVAIFYIYHGRTAESELILKRAKNYFERKKSRIGSAFCNYVDALLLYHRQQFKEAFAKTCMAFNLASKLNPWIQANALLLISLHALMLGELQRAKIYAKAARILFEEQKQDFILLKAVELLLLCIEDPENESLLESIDLHLESENAKNNYLFSLPLFAMYLASLKKDEKKTFQYYAELIRTKVSIIDLMISNAFGVARIKDIIKNIEGFKQNTLEYNSMRANLENLQLHWSYNLLPKVEELKVDFSLFDANISYTNLD
ncbi:MAG: protein kinase [Bradymonadales bacterium]|jgi:serine/threonine protein kinase